MKNDTQNYKSLYITFYNILYFLIKKIENKDSKINSTMLNQARCTLHCFLFLCLIKQ